MLAKILVIFFIVSCSQAPQKSSPAQDTNTSKITTKEFSRGELILGTQLLTKIFDGEMAPLECVESADEAEILLRTIRPRMEVAQDDLEAALDRPEDVTQMIQTCDQNCTCGFIDELLREHLVDLTKSERAILNTKKTDKELSRCMNFARTTFCQSELYKTLNFEKSEFTYEGEL